jgi:uncharacterized protein YwgA
MQNDSNLQETLQSAYDKLQLFFDNNQYGPEHRELILKHEKLSDSILKLNIVAIEKQSKNLTILHEDFKAIKKEVDTAMAEINNVIDNLDKAVKITNILGKAVSFITK